MFLLNNELDHMNLSNGLLWFQQNTKNAYKKSIGDAEWAKTENKDNYVFGEMFRVTMIGPDEALITGKINYFPIFYYRRRAWVHVL